MNPLNQECASQSKCLIPVHVLSVQVVWGVAILCFRDVPRGPPHVTGAQYQMPDSGTAGHRTAVAFSTASGSENGCDPPVQKDIKANECWAKRGKSLFHWFEEGISLHKSVQRSLHYGASFRLQNKSRILHWARRI